MLNGKLFILLALLLFGVHIQSKAAFPLNKKIKSSVSAQQVFTNGAIDVNDHVPQLSVSSSENNVSLNNFYLDGRRKDMRYAYKHHHQHHTAFCSSVFYVIMSILFFGWLAIAINENFNGWEWILCLGLYFIFLLPGILYAISMMHRYYYYWGS